mmetsp:Transcript_71786/g.115911  ORF Transcript_71786/g.115911 Transcript_71786/m.115911 type:complete len:213 (+) Transcript_71786:195-833(+)
MLSSKAFPYAQAISRPLSVSTKTMPAMNMRGSSRIHSGFPRPLDIATTPRSPTSLEVSKPRPNKKPTGSMCQGSVIPSKRRGQHLMQSPAMACSCPPYLFCSFQSRQSWTAEYRFSPPTANRKLPEIDAPMTPPTSVKFCKWCFMKSLANATAMHIRTTTEEWPRAKKNPTVAGRLWLVVSLRVTLSMAAMWSASTACLSPKEYARSPDDAS